MVFQSSVGMYVNVCASLVLLAYVTSASENDIFPAAPVVCPQMGCLRGRRTLVQGKIINQYVGIPYAMPPTGANRFKKPEPQYSWGSHVFNATATPPSCPQHYFYADTRWNNYDVSINEDCLYLNVWSPEECYFDETCDKKPVVVFIHGGAFTYGGIEKSSGDLSNLAATANVVAVSMNYRLNALGFLYGRSEDVPGNVGLYDQNMALKWVKDNIESFNGDPKSVTIVGHDAGAQSVGYHIVSPKSRNLFKRAVLLSGSPYTTMPLNKQDIAYNRGIAVARKLGCSADKLMECLREKDAMDVAAKSQYEYRRGDLSLLPVFGEDFLPRSPKELMKEIEDIRGLEVLMGITEEDGSDDLYYNGYFDAEPVEEMKMGDISYAVGLFYGMMYKKNALPIIKYYLGNVSRSDPSDMIKAGGRAIGDGMTLCPENNFAEDLADRGAKVYYFMLTQKSSFGSELLGPTGGEDMLYMLGSMSHMTANDEERKLSHRMMRMVGEFARTGRPSLPLQKPWPPYSRENPFYVSVSARNMSINFGPRLDECAFWQAFWAPYRGRSGGTAPKVQHIVLG
ncbi:acetylcholinesterase-like isoform X2 [Ornithodoros turicata]|uniref:acetylcholinesterase-like isoform X2 n=1 Tax=Ornithodoros turicata TaxID=34597 RepID=UPI003138DD65